MTKRLDKLTLEITRSCPCKCLHCSSLATPESDENMAYSEIKNLISQARDMQVGKIILSGGEPFSHPRLPEIVQYLTAYGIRAVVYTSGLKMSKSGGVCSISSRAITNIINRGCNNFNVSLHAGTASVHDELTAVQGSWEKTSEFLERACILGANVHVHCVITRFCIDNLDNLVEHLNRIGVSTLRLLRLVPQGRAKEHLSRLMPSEADWVILRSYLDSYSRVGSPLKIQVGAHLEGNLGYNSYQCALDSKKLLIGPDYKVCVCPAMKGAEELIGAPNAMDDTLTTILSSTWRHSISDLKKPDSLFECPAQTLYARLLSPSMTMNREEICDA